MALYRYRPEDNRTPVADPIFGGLTYDGVYDDPRCAEDPRFEEIPEGEEPEQPDTSVAQGEGAPGDAEAIQDSPVPDETQPLVHDAPVPDQTEAEAELDPTQHPESAGPTEPDEQPPAEPPQADADQVGQEPTP